MPTSLRNLLIKDITFFFQEVRELKELWLTCSHAPLKDYSFKASAFNDCTGSPEPVTAQTDGD